jgi:signal transduction histidine kinase
LLLYDPKAAPFRMLRVCGQVTYGRAGEFFLADGTNGLRVTIRNSDHFAVGDLVEAVGFLELGGPIANLNEAVMRRAGSAALPAPVKLTPEHLLEASCAGALVTVDGLLMNHWLEGSEHILELQSGFLAFRARISSRGQSLSLPPSGSRLELTGVYAPQGKGPGDKNVNGFDLLLTSPEGVRVLATPPWWTLKRVIILAGILAGLLCTVLLWNNELKRKVLERGHHLEMEIRNRQEAELKHTSETERSRIARDLHDELGLGLTAVSLLASAGLDKFRNVEESNGRFRLIADKARTLVSGLDVIVWAIDPKHNSLESFADYLESSTKEVLSAMGISCRFQIPIECGATTLSGSVRHSLFFAVKEALNNAIRHASATEMQLTMSLVNHQLEIVIADNGCGFDRSAIQPGHGLMNLEERLAMLKGRCRIESQPGKGTTVKFTVPLPRD